MSSWGRRYRFLTLKEIYDLRQNHRKLSSRDILGRLSKEKFAKALISHQVISQRCEYDCNADAVLAEFGVSDYMIDGLA